MRADPRTAHPCFVCAQKQHNGKDLVGNNIKANGRHQLHQNGKHTAYVDVSNGKIAGVVVKNADTGDVPVTKYKTNKKMAMGPRSGVMRAGYQQVQYEYVDTVWIGYGYIDEWGDEQIYWFPYDMILDGDTGAIECGGPAMSRAAASCRVSRTSESGRPREAVVRKTRQSLRCRAIPAATS